MPQRKLNTIRARRNFKILRTNDDWTSHFGSTKSYCTISGQEMQTWENFNSLFSFFIDRFFPPKDHYKWRSFFLLLRKKSFRAKERDICFYYATTTLVALLRRRVTTHATIRPSTAIRSLVLLSNCHNMEMYRCGALERQLRVLSQCWDQSVTKQSITLDI